LTAALLSTDMDGIKALQAKGATLYYGIHNADECLYIPCGFIYADLPEGTLVYGARKAFAFAIVAAVENFDMLVAMYKAAGKPVEKMQAVAEKLSKAEKVSRKGSS
jgi:hypothetical protein